MRAYLKDSPLAQAYAKALEHNLRMELAMTRALTESEALEQNERQSGNPYKGETWGLVKDILVRVWNESHDGAQKLVGREDSEWR